MHQKQASVRIYRCMNKTKLVFSQYFDKDINENILESMVDNSITTISLLNEKKIILKSRWVVFSWYLSALSVLSSLLWLYVDLKNSGSLVMIKILVNGFSAVMENWQDYLLSLIDLAPIYSLFVAILSLAVFIMFSRLKNNFSRLKLNHFVI